MTDRILLIEDNPADAELLAVAFEDAGICVSIDTVRDGREAMRRLMRPLETTDLALIVLDINIPIVSGLDLLAVIKSDPALRKVPTVMLTSSDRAQDRARARLLEADGYLIKPRELAGYGDIAAALAAYLHRPSATPIKR